MCSSQLRKWLQNWWKTFFHFCGGKDLNKKWIYNVNSKSCLPPKNCWWNFKFICVMNVNCSKKIFERATQFSKQGLDRGMENGRWLSGGLIWKKLSFQSRLKWKFFSYQPHHSLLTKCVCKIQCNITVRIFLVRMRRETFIRV